jgi:hypothetical protein
LTITATDETVDYTYDQIRTHLDNDGEVRLIDKNQNYYKLTSLTDESISFSCVKNSLLFEYQIYKNITDSGAFVEYKEFELRTSANTVPNLVVHNKSDNEIDVDEDTIRQVFSAGGYVVFDYKDFAITRHELVATSAGFDGGLIFEAINSTNKTLSKIIVYGTTY